MPSAATQAGGLTFAMPGADLAVLYPWLEAAAQASLVPSAMRHAIHVALEEAVMNVAMHAFGPGEAGTIHICLCATVDAVALVVRDSGRPFDQATAPARPRAARLEETVPGGRGLTLLRHYCRDLRYERTGGYNRLTLRFPLATT